MFTRGMAEMIWVTLMLSVFFLAVLIVPRVTKPEPSALVRVRCGERGHEH
jgi:hypothetical protein